MNPYDINLHSKKITKNKKTEITTIQILRKNKLNMKNKEIFNFTKSLLKKKKDKQKLVIRALTNYGWTTFLSYGATIEGYEDIEDYLDGRVQDPQRFNDDISQFHVSVYDFFD